MKKITLLFAFFIMLWQVDAQVAIGAGNIESGSIPFEPFYGYSYSQSIYLASEINASGTITDIQWYYSGSSELENSQELVIYMAESSRSEYADTDDWEPISSFTQVYEGGITVTAGESGWVTLTLDTPFNYTGIENLIIAVEENGDSYDNYDDDFYNSSVATDRSIYYRSDLTTPDPAAPPSAIAVIATIPNIILGGITQACPNPTDLTVTSANLTEANIAWTPGGTETAWNIEYGTANFTPGNGEEESATSVTGTPEVSLSGLTSYTEYYVYIQADCGGNNDTSGWTGPITFLTGYCDSTPSSNDGNGITQIELGGETLTSGGDINYEDFTDTTIDLASSVTADMQVTFDTSFYAYYAYIWIDFNNDLVFDNETELVFSGQADPADYLDASFLMPDVPLGIYYMRMVTAYSSQTTPDPCYSGTWGVTADMTINVTEAPDCIPPNTLTADNIGPDGAELSWNQYGDATLWNIEVVPAGTEPTGTPTETDVTNPYTVNELDGLTSYDYYVQVNCGDELSTWVGPYTFTTLCDIYTPDYIELFNDVSWSTIPDCWDEADTGDITTGPTDLGTSSWTNGDFLDSNAYRINIYGSAWSSPKSDWIISPQFDLTGGPFQVEFDLGVLEYGSTTDAGTLGSDDTVQLLMTTDGGATWITLLTYDNTSVFTATGEHPVVDLTAYSDQIVQFGILASEGTVVDSGVDVNVFVDNFRVRGIPTCAEPTDLAASNLSLTETELSWTENGSSTSWNIEYGETGFTLGTGVTLNEIDSNPITITDLEPDTSYEFYVSAICGPGDESSFSGPFQFLTGYCESIPAAIDGTGVNNVNLALIDFPSPGSVTYENHTDTVVNIFQGLETSVSIEYGHTYGYFTNVWIDFNDNLVFEESELVFQGESPGGVWGDSSHLYDFSFLVPITAQAGEHRMRIVGTDFEQTPANPCFSDAWGVTLDFTVNIDELTCTLAEATYSTVPDCENEEFYIDVDITSLGDADTLEISNTYDDTTLQASNTEDEYLAGPFPFGSSVRIYVTNEQDNNCVISSDTYEILACPPSNDDCINATVAVVNELSNCEQVTPGTILAATPSGLPDGTCTGNPDDDVWFEFTALNEVQIISITNISDGTTNLDHAVYEGDCGNLTEMYCSEDDSSVTPQLVVGNTYYVRIFSGGSTLETSTFDLCIRTAPSNTICENGENFCSEGGELTTSNVIGIPSTGSVACLYSIPNPTWNIIQIDEPGDIEIEISQADDSGNGIDVDFVIWGPFESVEQACTDILLEDCPSCPNNTWDSDFYPFGNIVDCSYDAASVENLTIPNAQSNEIYMLLVTNYNGNPGTITIEQTNINAGDNGTIDAEITADIVSPDAYLEETDNPEVIEANTCGYDFVTLEVDSPFADEFIWLEDGYVMEGETSSSIIVTESNNYQVLAIDNQCGAEDYSQIVIVNLYDDPGAVEPQNITLCDGPEADGTEAFDLDALSESLALDGFTISYYTNTADANQRLNPVESPYTSAGETLIMRIEDTAAFESGFLGCRQMSQVTLTVNPRPEINQPEDFIVCDDLDGVVDGSTEFDLEAINSEITTDPNIEITYHTSQEDANTGDNALVSPYSSAGETIYARAEDLTTGCYETTTFNLEINLVPLADIDTQYDNIVCPNATVPITIGITPTNFSDTEVSISWEFDGSPIDGNALTLDTVLLAGEYTATIEFNDSGCKNTITIEVEEAESCIFPEGISPGVTPGQNDRFDLSSFNVTRLEIYNRYGTLVYSKDNYRDEWVGQTNDGEELPVGTYFYTAVYEGGAKTKSAWVYINR